jgi:Arc/MetJ family transcription regulator
MAKINIEIDEVACRKAMERYQLATMEDAVNFALNRLINEPMTLEEALAMEGSGWIGDLAEMRAARFPLV